MSEEIFKARSEEEVSDNESHSESENETSESGSDSGSENTSSSGSGSGSDSDEEDGEYEIDLSDNEIYKGIFSLFEDEEGNNILNYISLLHNELQGLNEQMKNFRPLRKDVGRIADSLEKLVSLKEAEMEEKKAKKAEKSK
jgi:hypothetical protein